MKTQKTKTILKAMNKSENSNLNKILLFIKKHNFILSFISGMIFATPFLCEWLFPCTFISLIVFFRIIHLCVENPKTKKDFRKDLRKTFIRFFLFFFGCCLIVYTLFFELYPFESFDFTPFQGKIIVLFAWIASSIIHGVMFGAILSISYFFKSSPLPYALACGSLWVIFEWTLTLGFLAFPWISVSLALIKLIPFLQTASIFGNGIISFITVFSCCLFAISSFYEKRKLLLKTAVLTLALNLIVGTVIFFVPEKREKEVSVCLVQGNVSMVDRGIVPLRTIVSNHESLIRESLKNGDYDLVLLSETVFPAIYTDDGIIYGTFSKIAKEFDVTIIFGVSIKGENNETYNAIMGIHPSGKTTPYYIKQKLVPFGEAIPDFDVLSTIVPYLKELKDSSSYVSGNESTLIVSHDGTVYGPLVCYDSVFPELSRKNALLGAEILAMSTNDAWYKDGFAVYHHQNQSIIRAIETGKYVFRSANTGVSCIINTKGIVIEESEVLTETTVCGKGYTTSRKTIFTILGNTSLYLSFAYIILFSFYLAKKNIKKND